MDIINKILSELTKTGKSQKELCDFLHLSPNVFTDWKANRNKSYLKYVHGIAAFLDVSVDYLLGKTDIKKAPQNGEQYIEGIVLSRNGERVQFKLSPEKLEIIEKLTRELADSEESPDF